MKKLLSLLIVLGVVILILSLKKGNKESNPEPIEITKSDEFKSYWYDGKAEITSYKLEQARYGEIHSGSSVMIFVTENFSKKKWVKSDRVSKDNSSVLKLNSTKKFNTGIYPYSIMTSTFVPVKEKSHALKISLSSQEWCGQSFMQMTNTQKEFKIESYSYFESEGDRKESLDLATLEDELLTQIRLDPNSLPLGSVKVIPSFSYLSLMHKELKPYEAEITKQKKGKGLMEYSIVYEELGRELKITFDSVFPYQITGWIETYESGFGAKKTKLTTVAIKLVGLKVDYWNKNKVEDGELRAKLKLQ
jgi:hypothetical protein